MLESMMFTLCDVLNVIWIYTTLILALVMEHLFLNLST
jgi:hypothetical protein